MKRPFLVALAIAGALFGTAGAQAKAPPDGVDICGSAAACVHLSMQDAETNWALWTPADPYQSTQASSAHPFLVVHWHWPGQAEQSAYYVPATGKVRQVGAGVVAWYDVTSSGGVKAMTAALEPFPVPKITRVTVGRRTARNPQSYLALFRVGHDAFPAILPGWLPIRFAADTPSPWTDPGTDVRISRTGNLLWVDGTMLRIPLQLVRRIRRGASLRG